MSTSDPLSAASLASIMSNSLPRGVSPQIKNAYEAVALAVHAGMLSVGFKLKGLGEDHHLEQADTLPQEWNASSSYNFRYSHPQSAMEYIVKIGRLGSKATVDAIAIGDEKPASFHLAVADYISQGSLPATPVEEGASSSQSSAQNIQDVFISAGRLTDLGSLLKSQIIQKLAPGIQKEGYEESSAAASSTSRRRDPDEPSHRESQQPRYDPLRDPLRHDPPARPHPFNDPTAPQPTRPFPPGLEPPGFEDEYDILRAPGRGGQGSARHPFNIGHDDLYPQGLGPNDPFNPTGIGLPRPGGGTGGMHPTFDDPLFGGAGGIGGGGGRRGDPQVPGGARYDPIHPGDPRGGPGTFPGAGHRGGYGGGGGPPNPFGGFGSGDFI